VLVIDRRQIQGLGHACVKETSEPG
jgi:hypothetical protein